MSCEFAHLDGAYVLGALAPAERQEFERHLLTCDECARSVRELAGLPGLLARVGVEALVDPPTAEPPSPTLLPTLLAQVRRAHRRRVVVAAGLAAAAVVAVAGGTTAIVADGNGTAPPASTSAPVSAGSAMTPVGQDRMTAELALEAVAWGTRLDLTCRYATDAEYAQRASGTYAMVIRTRDGRSEQVATWQEVPGKTMRLAAATATRRSQIASVEIRAADGARVLTTSPR